jgi:branched-chain amino acid transport system ATP-binding protein
MTVAENLELGGLALGRRPKSPEFKAIYELFPILRQRELQMAGTLSGGEQHMLAIGRALMARPVMLLLDEPTGGLAPIVVEQVRHGIGLLAEQGIAVVIAEQNLDLVDHMDCKTHLIDRGVVKWSGMSGKLRQIPAVVDAILGSKRDRERRLGATTTRPESGHHTPEQ